METERAPTAAEEEDTTEAKEGVRTVMLVVAAAAVVVVEFTAIRRSDPREQERGEEADLRTVIRKEDDAMLVRIYYRVCLFCSYFAGVKRWFCFSLLLLCGDNNEKVLKRNCMGDVVTLPDRHLSLKFPPPKWRNNVVWFFFRR